MGGLKSIFKAPKTPKIEPPAPLPDEEQATAARRRGVAKAKKQQGVASTILSSGERETLGG